MITRRELLIAIGAGALRRSVLRAFLLAGSFALAQPLCALAEKVIKALRIGFTALLIVGFSAPSALGYTTADYDLLFNWAEIQYPSLFSPAGARSRTAYGYYFRHYPNSNTYLGVSGTNVYFLQGGQAIIDVGKFSDFYPLASAYYAQGSYALSSIAGDGVQGSPTTSSAKFALGTSVPFAFTPAPGYSSTLVTVDGVLVPPSGTVTMNADHWLWAFGNPQIGTQFTGMMTVPSDFTLIPYRQFYQNPPSFNFTVADPYCALTSGVVAYPTSYLGAFPLPPVQGAPLSAAIRRGAAVKDYWAYGLTNAATNSGCSGDLHTAFLVTLERLKKLGADHVNIYRDAVLADANATQLQFINAASWSISDSELTWIVSQAKAFGLEVHEYRQIVPEDSNNVALPSAPTQTWASNYLDAYTQYIVDRARVAQQNGVEAFQLDWGVYWFDWTPYRSLFISKMTNAAQQVRSVFSGKIIYGQTAPWISGDPALLNSIDWFIGDLFMINFNAADNASISVPQLKQKYLDLINAMANALGPSRKPMIWQVYAQSHRNYLLNGWVEDGFCVAGCMQQTLQTDFSVQAIQYEAMLEAIVTQTLFSTASVDAKAYWYVDVILPKDSFPNISQSPRNKPAESILYQWFKQ